MKQPFLSLKTKKNDRFMPRCDVAPRGRGRKADCLEPEHLLLLGVELLLGEDPHINELLEFL